MNFIDFEFNRVIEEKVNLVCCTIYDLSNDKTTEWWLHNQPFAQSQLKEYLLKKKNEKFFSWAVTAEARAFQSLGIDPVIFNWIDGFLEYRCLTNHNAKLAYGEQLVDGVIKKVGKKPPKWKQTEEDKAGGFKPKHNLAEATFKLLNEVRDTAHKDAMRDLIISDPPEFTPEQQHDIMKYCTEDVVFLPALFDKICEQYEELLEIDYDGELLMEEMLLRGKYSALTAKMESRGYPIDFKKTKNFATSVGPLMDECQCEINNLFPDVMPFKYKRADRRFAMDTKAIRAWLHANVDTEKWMKTDGGKSGKKDLSLSLDAWTNVFDFKHDYPKNNFGAQMVRYLKLKQNLNGFSVSKDKKKKTFWDSVGPDERVRPYFNIYGAQSSRSQPGSTGFLFLKPAWMRSLCSPKSGRAICGIDYGSEEFFISALVAEDQNMIDAYLSGDVYLYFAKLAGAVPMEGTRERYKVERNIFKAVTLSISYLQTAQGLSKKLTEEIGEEFTEQQAKELIAKFYEVYSDFAVWQKKEEMKYKQDKRVKLPCGWYMWGDNENHRSVANVPVQGFGASIMRKAVEFAEEAGLEVIVTLHDALYIEYDSFDFAAIDKLRDAMRRAFMYYFNDPKIKDLAGKIKMDIYTWSPDYPAPEIKKNEKGEEYREYQSIVTPAGEEVDYGDLYIDERASKEYEQFKGYFDDRPEDDWL